jgi:RHS repeat-associated protein
LTFDAVTGLLTRETNGDGEAVEYFYEPRSSRMTALSRGERRVRLRYGKGAADQANNTVGRVKDALYDLIPPPIDTHQQARARCINDTLCSSEVYTYDALGQQVRRTRELPGGETLSTHSALDSFGRVQQLTHVRGGDTVDVSYRYNSAGRVTHAEGKAHGMARTWVDSVQSDHQGRTVGIQFGNGVRKEYSYDAQTDWMTRVVACAPAFGGPSCSGSSKVYQDLALTHSPAGDILTSTTRATVNGLLTGQVWGFGYDKRHRLVSSFLTGVNPSGGALTWQEGWTFDALHRLTSRTTTKSTETGVETRAEQFTFTGLHQPRCATPGSCEEERTKYDGAGRVTHLTSPTGDARTLQWTHDSMLRSVTEVGGGVLQENGYALAGERTTRSGAYGTYRYLGPTVTDGPTGLNAHVWVNGSRVATAFPAGTYFYVGDQLGSTTMVLDSGGDVVTQVVQSPYGREIYQSAAPDWAPPAQQFLLTGKERDPETGFHAYGWRDWSSAGNHWLAPEPIWEDALKQDAVGLNLYQHTRWNPVRGSDPDGRAPLVARGLSDQERKMVEKHMEPRLSRAVLSTTAVTTEFDQSLPPETTGYVKSDGERALVHVRTDQGGVVATGTIVHEVTHIAQLRGFQDRFGDWLGRLLFNIEYKAQSAFGAVLDFFKHPFETTRHHGRAGYEYNFFEREASKVGTEVRQDRAEWGQQAERPGSIALPAGPMPRTRAEPQPGSEP